MIRRAFSCGAAAGLCEAARAVATTPHTTLADGAATALLALLAYSAVTAAAAAMLRPIVGRRLTRAGADERRDRLAWAVASGCAAFTLVGTMRLRALVHFAQPALLQFVSGPLLEGAVAGLVVAWAASRLPGRSLRFAWSAAAAAGLATVAALGARDAIGERLTPVYSGRPRPSVLLISVDTLRADRLGVYGGPPGLTPRLDRLAGQSVTFDIATSPMPLTGPAHTTMLTGLEPSSHGAMRNGVHLRADVETVAERLAAAGLRTGAFVGAWPLSHAASGLGTRFQHYDDDVSWHRALPSASENLPLVWLADRTAMFLSARRAEAAAGERFFAEVFERGGETTVQRALRWIARRPDRPFFAFVHFYEPHAPYTPPAAVMRLLDPHAADAPARFDHMESGPHLGEIARDPEAVARIRRLYDGEVAHVDALVGHLLDGLARTGREGDTVVIFTSDHGEGLGEHGEYFDHGEYLYETTTRVPLLVRLPGGTAAGRRVAEMARLADLAPTLLEIAAVPAREHLDGRSLVAGWSATSDAEEAIFAHASASGPWLDGRAGGAGEVRHSLRDERHKLIWTLDRRWPHSGDPAFEELFDLQEDPAEMRNLLLADQEPVVAERLRHELRARLVASQGGDSRLDPETARRLRALGYL